MGMFIIKHCQWIITNISMVMENTAHIAESYENAHKAAFVVVKVRGKNGIFFSIVSEKYLPWNLDYYC